MARVALTILGAPGAGKGTQARMLGAELNYPWISTGDMLREAVKDGTTLGGEVQGYMERGGLVPDALVDRIIRDRLAREDCRDGFILDGYPRTIQQAQFLDTLLCGEGSRILAIGITVGSDVLLGRLAGRWTCPKCGKMFNIMSNPSKAGDDCDECGTHLVLRKDDSTRVVEERLQVYHQLTEPLIQYYRSRGCYAEVDGEQSADQIHGAIMAIMKARLGQRGAVIP